MSTQQVNNIDSLLAKDAIRELALLYCRGVDRQDPQLLRSLYTADATDTHGDTFDGPASGYVDFLEQSFPYIRFSGHHVCNHLISVDGDRGEGEVYALAYHVIPDGSGGWLEDFMSVRYLDHYQRESDDVWRFAKRVVNYDLRRQRPCDQVPESHPGSEDISYATLMTKLFLRET